MRRIGKKSQNEIMFIIFQLMMITAIFASLMFYVGSLKNQTLFKKLALSRDLALTVNALYAAPGNIEYTYYSTNLNISEFDYGFSNQMVNVFEDERPTSYPYGEDVFFDSRLTKTKDQETIQFQNIGYDFLERKEIEIKPNLFKYPYVNINEIRGKVVVGFYGDENPLASQIAAELSANKEGAGRISQADTLIIAEIDNKNPKTLRIEVPANPDTIKQNRKLASIITNNALGRGNIDFAYIIPTIRPELNKAKTAVYISLGNEIPIIDISQLISKSLDEHFGEK